MQNEKISGETASVEVRNAVTKKFDAIPFVKENGEWKIALDVLVEEVQRKATDAMNEKPDKTGTDKK